MRSVKKYVAVLAALAGLACLPAASQQPQSASPSNRPQSDTVAAQAANSSAKSAQRAVPVQSTANAPEVENRELRPVQAQLENKLDSKTAKAGDAVVLKTTEQAATADGLVIPKGSRIVGQVVDAEPAGKTSQDAKVTVRFDHAELKGGKNLPIQSVLQSIAGESAAVTKPGESGGGESASERAQTASAGTAHIVPIGGSAVTAQTGSAAVSSQQSRAELRSTSGDNRAQVAGTVVEHRGDIAIKTTPVPGILIAASANALPSNASGSLLGARRDVHLDQGTQILLAVADAAMKGRNTR